MTLLLTGAGKSGKAAGGGGGAEASAFLARTSGLDTTHRNAYIALIDGLVADGVWSKLDMLHVYATQDTVTAQLNLISTSYPATLHGSPAFTADRGYQGVDASTTVWIGTGFTPSSVSSPKFVLNSAHISAWSVTNAAGTTNGPIGAQPASTGHATIFPKYNDNVTTYMRLNSTGLLSASISNASGHFIANRSASGALQSYRNGGSIATSSDASTSVPNAEVFTLSVNTSSGPLGSPHQVAMASIGSSLSSTDVTNFYNRLRTFMTVVGVP